MNKLFFVGLYIILFLALSSCNASQIEWEGFSHITSRKKVKIKKNSGKIAKIPFLVSNAQKIDHYSESLAIENVAIASEGGSDEDFQLGITCDDFSTFLYTKNVFQCVAVGIVKFFDNTKIERFLFHMNFLNPTIILKRRELKTALESLHGYRYKIAVSSAMYSKNVFQDLRMNSVEDPSRS